MVELSPFLIFALPRSMTAWTSCFLTCGQLLCQHELFAPGLTAKDVAKKIKGENVRHSGLADPGAILRWRELVAEMPNATLVYIRRPVADSRAALANRCQVSEELMRPGYETLEAAARDFLQHAEPYVMDYADLQTEFGARVLWQWVAPDVCLPECHLQKMLSLQIEQNPKLLIAACANSGPATKN